MVLARLGELDEAQAHLRHALDVHGLDRRRTRAIVLAVLGELHLRRGDPDTAIATWNEFVTCATGVRSLKVDTTGQDMRARLHRLRTDGIPGADELEHRAHLAWASDVQPAPLPPPHWGTGEETSRSSSMPRRDLGPGEKEGVSPHRGIRVEVSGWSRPRGQGVTRLFVAGTA
ncbi:hypothetical protein EHYA_09969 [Embleya hyalina]|uniref:Tetratricopeptide repeat protein n=2 Tax=Embleya hyalina TaxID=516124 RepID=A0A401Z5P7_9ACTN|nr:hypothetical protein EHYA_09969 [Embleya hyalina]